MHHELKDIFRQCGREFITFSALYQLFGGEDGYCGENGKSPIALPCPTHITFRKSNASVENELKDGGEGINKRGTFQTKVKEEQKQKNSSDGNQRILLNKVSRKGRKNHHSRRLHTVSKHIKGIAEYHQQEDMNE